MNAQETPLLCHYTAFEGLHGIITGGVLLASSLAYVNDTEEFLYTIKPLLSLVENMGVRLSDLMRGVGLHNSVPSLVKAFFGHVKGQNSYVTCFSKERDDLSQWRSYTPRPPGFAIGFHAEELKAAVQPADFEMLECSYPKPDELRAEVKGALEAVTVAMEDDRKNLPMPASAQVLEKFADKWGIKIIAAITKLAHKNKHPKFAAEREVRLHGYYSYRQGVNQRFTVEYRLSGSLVVPYVKIPARPPEGPSPIKVILVGPCRHQEAVIAATYQMCLQHHVRAEVLPSAVPYRNW